MLADDSRDAQHADARTLVTLLHLRDMEDKLGDVYSIVSEMNDDANREVAEVTKADDFVVSAKLISLYLTQLSENRQLSEVFAALFSPDGSGIHLKPAPHYVLAGTSTNFATVIEAARRRGETAIGYRVHADVRSAPHFGSADEPGQGRRPHPGGERSGDRARRDLNARVRMAGCRGAGAAAPNFPPPPPDAVPAGVPEDPAATWNPIPGGPPAYPEPDFPPPQPPPSSAGRGWLPLLVTGLALALIASGLFVADRIGRTEAGPTSTGTSRPTERAGRNGSTA